MMEISDVARLKIGVFVLYCVLGVIAYFNLGRSTGAFLGGIAGIIMPMFVLAGTGDHMISGTFWGLILAVPGCIIGAVLGVAAGAIGKGSEPAGISANAPGFGLSNADLRRDSRQAGARNALSGPC